MTVAELIDKNCFEAINKGTNLEIEISKPFCCDLLSIAMGKAPAHSAWITVMGNVNTLAVAALADIACIILAEGAVLDDTALKKAEEQKITVLRTEQSIFDASLMVHEFLK